MSDSTVAYLEAGKKKLAKKDLPASLIMDEVYVQKAVQYSNGKFHGLDDSGKAVKTLLCVMIKSIAGNYRDIIAMAPIVNINADILYKVWLNVLKVVSNLGFNVTDTMTDGHSSNVKFFTMLSQGVLLPSIPNPFNLEKQIFLLFDPVHLFKKIYNNVRSKELFICPSLVNCDITDQSNGMLHANFAHIRQLYDLESPKVVKMAHKITGKVINPVSIEKTNVHLADARFHNSTINALRYYAKNGYPHFTETADVLQIMWNWWDIMNVKSLFTGQQSINCKHCPLY